MVLNFPNCKWPWTQVQKQQDNLHMCRIIPPFHHATLASHIQRLNRIFIHILYTHLFLPPEINIVPRSPRPHMIMGYISARESSLNWFLAWDRLWVFSQFFRMSAYTTDSDLLILSLWCPPEWSNCAYMTGPCRKKVELEVWNNGWSLQVPRDQESQGRLAVWGQSESSEQRLGVQTSGFRQVLVYHDLIVPSNSEILKL